MPAIYTNIANPYMPQGTPDKTNAPTPIYAPGELGATFTDQNTGRRYLRVKLDSGATSVTPAGAVFAGQVAFWKDESAGIVTNDFRFADAVTATSGSATGYLNRVAGIFQAAVTAAPGVNGADGLPVQYVCDLCIQGVNVTVASDGTGVPGDRVVVSTAAGKAQVASLATPATAPTSQVVGLIKVAPASNFVTLDVNLAGQV